jgi:transposase
MDLRQLKALDLAARTRIVFDGSVWLVPSQTTGSKYRVSIAAEPSCQCEDFSLRQQPCKHILAARLVCAREHNGHAPEVITDALPQQRTYKQDWPRYNLAQATEKRRFRELLFDLCRDLQQPPLPRTGRRPHQVRDAVFAMAYKVYSGFSSRRFDTDLCDAHQAGLLSVRIPAMKVNAFLENATFSPILRALIVRSSLPLKSVETIFAPDSTGFSASRFVRWHDEKYGVERSGRDWVKAHAICGVKTNIVTAVVIEGRDAGDSPQFKPLLQKTAENFTIKEVPADKAYLSHDNLALVESLGGAAYVPFKSNSLPGEAGSLWEKMFLYYNLHREEFLKHYHQRSNAESTFSMVKAKFRDHVRSRVSTAMVNEVLCKFLCHNICVVHQSHIELGLEPVFRSQENNRGDGPAPLRRAVGQEGSGTAPAEQTSQGDGPVILHCRDTTEDKAVVFITAGGAPSRGDSPGGLQ